MAFTLLVNGAEHHLEGSPEQTLLSALRDDLNLTGTKYGCGEGQCGACTVLIEGRPVRSCQTLARAATGKKITTIEGLEREGKLHPVQAAVLEHEAFQCGYCTPGMIMSAVGLLATQPRPSEQEIIRRMNGTVCRCGACERSDAAIQSAAGKQANSNG